MFTAEHWKKAKYMIAGARSYQTPINDTPGETLAGEAFATALRTVMREAVAADKVR